MLKTMMQADPHLTGGLGEPDAWDAPRWADKETYASDYDRAIASLREPELALPEGRRGRSHRPARSRPAGSPRTADHADRDAPALWYADFPTAPARVPAPQPVDTPAHDPDPHRSTLSDFRTLARTIEEMRGGRVEAALQPESAASAPRTWLDHVREASAHAEPDAGLPTAAARVTAPRPMPRPETREAVGAVADENLAHSLRQLMGEVSALANKAEVARLEDALHEVVRRVATLEAQFRPSEPRQALPPAPAARRIAPPQTSCPSASPQASASIARQTLTHGAPQARKPIAPPRRITVEVIEARIAERREAARRAAEAAPSQPERAPEAAHASPRQLHEAGHVPYGASRAACREDRAITEAAVYEPRARSAPRRLFS